MRALHAAGQNEENATANENKQLRQVKLVELRGIEPLTGEQPTSNTSATKPTQNRSKSRHANTLPTSSTGGKGCRSDKSPQNADTSVHKKCVPGVYGDLPADLAEIVASWSSLPDALKVDILKKVREAIGD